VKKEQGTMEDKLREIVARIAETDTSFSLGANLRDELYVDSVRALEILFEIQKDMGIRVPESRLGEVRTFGDLASVVASVGAKA
jgi:acyl carrier protein